MDNTFNHPTAALKSPFSLFLVGNGSIYGFSTHEEIMQIREIPGNEILNYYLLYDKAEIESWIVKSLHYDSLH